MGELWDVLDRDRNKTGLLHERGSGRMVDGQYHLVVQVWVINDAGQCLMSKRHPDKRPYPLMWESTGGSVVAGETSVDGAVREVSEELGIALDPAEGRMIKSTCDQRRHEFYDVWLFRANADIRNLTLQAEEVVDARWMTPQEIAALQQRGELHPKLDYYREVFASCTTENP